MIKIIITLYYVLSLCLFRIETSYMYVTVYWIGSQCLWFVFGFRMRVCISVFIGGVVEVLVENKSLFRMHLI